MSLKDRIFDLVFPERKRERNSSRRVPPAGSKKKAGDRADPDSFDARYFIHRRR